MHIEKDLVAASATPLVLGILAEGESYGYAILKRVNDLSGGRIQWTDGMLYPLLHRLERLGLVSASWGASDSGAGASTTRSPIRAGKCWRNGALSGRGRGRAEPGVALRPTAPAPAEGWS